MTGPEHYAEAQRLILGTGQFPPTKWVALAQVHATLATAAATVDGANAIVDGKRVDDEWGITWESA